MLKLFRKYNKILLAVGAVVLMVAFLLPDATRRLSGDPMKRVVARYDGGEITQRDLIQAERDLEMLKGYGPGVGPQLLRVKNNEHWILLEHEARRAGLVGGPGDAQRFLQSLADTLISQQVRQALMSGMQPTPEMVENARTQLLSQFNQIHERQAAGDRTRQDVDDVLARAQGVIRLYDVHLGAAQLSRQESVALARKYHDEVKIDYAILAADSELANAPEPTDEQIAAQFEKYKGVPPGEGEHGFGYELPDAVELQWIKIDRQVVSDSVKLDPIKVYTTWQENKSRYGDDFAKARPQVEDALRKEAVAAIILDAERLIKAELIKGERLLEEEGRFKNLPPDWESTRPSFEGIVRIVFDKLREQRAISQPPALPVTRHDLLSRGGVSALTEIGASYMNVGTQRVPFDALAFSVRELDAASPYGLQVGVAAGPTRDPQGNEYYFRVTRARKASPPPSVDTVRARIVTDLRRLGAYERMVANAPAIRQEASTGFEEVAQTHKAPIVGNVGVRLTGMEMADRKPVEETINIAPVRDAIMATGDKLDPTIPAEQIPSFDRTLTAPLPATLALAIIRITSVEPVSVENFRILDPVMAAQAQRDLSRTLDWPYSFERLSERLGFTRIGDERKPSGGAPAKTGAKPASAGADSPS